MHDINHTDVKIGETVTVSRQKNYRNPNMPKFSRIGINPNKEDLLDLLARVTKPTFVMFTYLKNHRSSMNLVSLAPAKNRTEANSQTLALRELTNVGLVKKVGTESLKTPELHIVKVPKRTYMINPGYLFPVQHDDFDAASAYWKQLQIKKKVRSATKKEKIV